MNRLQQINKITANVKKLNHLLDSGGLHHRSLSLVERQNIQQEITKKVLEYQRIYANKH
jgi:hypothetical protein